MAREGRLFLHTVWLGGSAAACKLLSLLLLPLFTRMLTPAELGMIEIFVSTAVLLLPLATLYAPQAAFRFSMRGEHGVDLAGAKLEIFGLLLTLALLFLLPLKEMSAFYKWYLFFYVAASALHTLTAQLLRARGAFGIFALQQCFCAALTVLLQLLFIGRGQGPWGYLRGVILGDLITFAVLLLPLFLFGMARERPGKRVLYGMLRYALPLIPTALAFWVMSAAERYFLVHFHGRGALGLYAAAGRFPALIGFAGGIFLEVWHYAAIREKEEGRSVLFDRIFALLLPTMIGGGVLLSLAAPLLVEHFLAREYAACVYLLPLLSLSAVCAGLSHFLDSVYTVRMRSLHSFWTILCTSIAHLVLCFLLIPRWGALGAGAASALSFGGLYFLRLWHTSRELAFTRHFSSAFLSFAFFFLGALLFATKLTISGSICMLLSLLPQLKAGIYALRFLWHRFRVMFKSVGKAKKSIEKEG